MLKIKPAERENYPDWFSKSQLKEMGLMPSKEASPVALCVRQIYGDYYLYSKEDCVSYCISDEARKKRNEASVRRKKLHTCPVCRKYIGTYYSFEVGKYPGMCDACFRDKRKSYYALLDEQKCCISSYTAEKRYPLVVLDVETTGTSSLYDEIIQLSILGGDGEVLFNKNFKPFYHIDYPEASYINGLYYSALESCDYIFDSIKVINSILQSADKIVGFNVTFDLEFIKMLGINVDAIPTSDVMIDFAEMYGEEDEYHGGYRWKSLSFCANFFQFKYVAHDSLEDCKATLYCYKELKKLRCKMSCNFTERHI